QDFFLIRFLQPNHKCPFYCPSLHGTSFENDFSVFHIKQIIMDSINKNQPEDNFKALVGEEAIGKLKEMGKDAPTCFFCTKIKKGQSFSTRPMSVQQVDDEGNFWFLSAADSHKNAELKTDKSVQLLFQESRYADFLTVYGKAKITKNKAKIK